MFANIFKKRKAKRSEVEMDTENKEVQENVNDVADTQGNEQKVEDNNVTPETQDVVEDNTVAETSNAIVEDVEPVGNGVDINDLVTKDMLADRLSAFESKLDALIKENEDLKNKLAEKDGELNGMKDKYENKDFGTIQKQGVMPKNKQANDTFAEYAKQFM